MVAIHALGEKLSCREVFLENHIFDIRKNDDLRPPETLKMMILKRFRCADAHCGSHYQYLAEQAPSGWKRNTRAGTEASRPIP